MAIRDVFRIIFCLYIIACVNATNNEVDYNDNSKDQFAAVTENKESCSSTIRLNVGGTYFTTTKEVLMKHKGSYFDTIWARTYTPRDENGQVFIDRDPKYFGVVLNFLRDGRLRLQGMGPEDISELEFEFSFYKLVAFPEPKVQQSVVVQPTKQVTPDTNPATLLFTPFEYILRGWLPNKHFLPIYKATKDGFLAMNFHKQCDNRGPTITLIQSTGGFLFGAYSPMPWTSTTGYSTHPDAFLFTIINPHLPYLPPTKFALKDGSTQAIYNTPLYGPIFGGAHDILVVSAANATAGSYVKFPFSYIDSTGKGASTFTGTEKFIATEVEVYTVL